ncbi:peptidoglycan-binding domain-containing protein [Portibacter lacus]|uniref:Peptidoglycan binding-like domain-containing protein n=1 Tax=Portibacter lacus TaxID=1099794 RepID=A0AA37SQY0_9BACT|nr:peptidoglycan-binding domain-containing protein [Portibacter lacus]GLR18310.1 hypothetical protein GCM10007940_29260 [Portibacter lacus]
MSLLKRYFFTFISLIILNHVSGQRNEKNDDFPPAEPGKCYAKCLIEDQIIFKTDSIDLIIYAGSKKDNPYVQEESILINEANKLTYTFLSVIDTTQEKDFIIHRQAIKWIEDVIAGGYTEWQEVVCEEDITPTLVAELRKKLYLKGYGQQSELKEGSVDSNLKAALVNYQKNNGLPIGSFDIKTLASLDLI